MILLEMVAERVVRQGPTIVRVLSVFSGNMDDTEIDLDESIDSQVIRKNQPILMEVYIDPDTQNEKVIIVASLTGVRLMFIFPSLEVDLERLLLE